MDRLGWLTGVAAGVLLAAACGGDDGGGSGAEASSAVQAATSTFAEATGGTGSTSTSPPAATAAPGEEATSGGSASVEAVDVCALVSPADVAAVVGVEPAAGVPEETIPGLAITGCSYDVEGDLVSITVAVWPDDRTAQESFQMAVDNNGYPLVDGVGEEAYDADPAFGLTARGGRYEVTVNVTSEADSELDQESALAALVIGRLP